MPNIDKKISTTFNRGLNQAASHTIDPNECAIAQNIMFKDKSATVRNGYAVYGSTPAPVVSLRKFYTNDGANYFCAVAGGVFYSAVTSGTFASVSSVAISGPVGSVVYDGAVYFTDYSTPVKFFDGNRVDIAGLSSPVFRKQLNDFENINQWTVNTFGAIANDFTYTHRDLGKQSILFSASSPTTAAVFTIGGGTEMQSVIGGNFYSVRNRRSLTRDLSGNINVVLTSGNALYHAQSLNKGSTWINTVIDNFSYIPLYPFIAVDSSNNLHVATVISGTPNLAYYKRDNLSGWGSQFVVSGLAGTYLESLRHFNGAIDMSSNLHIAWAVLTSSSQHPVPSLVNSKVQYVKFNNATSSWTNVSLLSNTSTVTPDRIYTNMIIDHSNIIHTAWMGWSQISSIESIFYLNSQNISAQNITSGIPFQSEDPVLAIDTSANVHCLWTGTTTSSPGNYQIQYRKFTLATSSWGSSVYLTSENTNQILPNVSLETNNKIHAMWYGQSVQSPSFPTIRYAANLSGWGPIQNLNQLDSTFSEPVFGMAYSIHPKINGSSINKPNVGWAIAYRDGNGNGVANYHGSFDLTYAGDPTAPKSLDLTHFASDTSSDLNDLVNVFTVHDVKTAISSIVVQFIDSNSFTASQEITAMSSWQSCSNDQFALTHVIPKVTMTLSNTSFNWASCDLQIQMTCVSTSGGQTAFCNIDNIRMVKTPPIIDYSTSTAAKSNLLFFGSSVTVTQTAAAPQIVGVQRIIAPFAGQFDGYFVTYADGTTANLTVDEYNGVTSPPAPPGVDEITLQGLKMLASPLPDDTYFYKTTFLKLSPSGFEIESNPSNQTSSFAVTNPTSAWVYTHLTDIPIAPASMGVVGRRIYRRRQSNDTMQNVYTIHDNVKTNFLDTVPALALGMALEEDHTPPPQAKIILKTSQQVIYYLNVVEVGTVSPSRIRFSKPYEPYYCPNINLIDVSPDDGQELTGGFEFSGILHVLKNKSTWTIDNITPSNIHTAIGCVAPNSVAVGKNEVFWLSEEGVIRYRLYRFDNISHSKRTNPGDESVYRIQKILDRLPKDQVKNAQGIYYNGLYLLALTDTGSTTNNTVLCYDTDNDAWSEFPNLNVNCWETWLGGQEGYRLFFGNNSGLVCEFLVGDYDISTPIWSVLQSKDFGMTTPTEFFRKSYIYLQDLDGNGKTLNIQPIYDFVLTSSKVDSQTLTLTSGQFSLIKSPLPMGDDASFFALNISTSGRYKINQVDIYGREEKLR